MPIAGNLEWLTRLDAARFIECWGNNDICDEIVFQRLNLTFKKDGDKFVCDRFPGYSIDSQQRAYQWRSFHNLSSFNQWEEDIVVLLFVKLILLFQQFLKTLNI